MNHKFNDIGYLARSNLRNLKQSLKQQRTGLLNKLLQHSTQNIESLDQQFLSQSAQPPSNKQKLSLTKYLSLQIDTSNNFYLKREQITRAKQKIKSRRASSLNHNSVLSKNQSLNNNKQQLNIRQRLKNHLKHRASVRSKTESNETLIFSKLRSNSQNHNKAESRLERIHRFSQERQRLSFHIQQKPTQYKNQKLAIIAQASPKIKLAVPQHLADIDRLKQDLETLIKDFDLMQKGQIQIARNSQNYRSLVGKLLYFIGYQIHIRYSENLDPDFQYYQLIISNYYQIYFSMRLKIPLLILQSYLVMIDFAMQKFNYTHAEKYAQKCLLASIYYRQKYYQQKSIQKISMCQYYKGNICQATYLHDNNGQVAQDSVRKIKDSYNQNQQIQIIFHHLYELPRFDIKQLLSIQQNNIKSLVVFKSPRINIDDSMKNKRDQMKVDVMKMDRLREFKYQCQIIKKQVKKHQNLFKVHKTAAVQAKQFKFVKRNLTINQDNQSSQILRAHQSLNRINLINKTSIKNKLNMEFINFCHKNLSKLL